MRRFTLLSLLLFLLPAAACLDDDAPDGPSDVDAQEVDDIEASPAALYDRFVSRGQNELESRKWSDWFCVGDETCDVGDFDGDGRDDIITFLSNGITYVSRSTGSSFASSRIWDRDFCRFGRTCTTADVNGDGRADAVAFDPSGRVFAALSTGSSFGALRTWHTNFCTPGSECALGDFDEDGDADLVRLEDDGDAFVALSNRSRFVTVAEPWTTALPFAGRTVRVGDLNADGKDDLAAFDQANARVHVAMANAEGDGFEGWRLARTDFCPRGTHCGLTDFDGDGAQDLVTFMKDAGVRDPLSGMDSMGDVYVSLSRADNPFRPREVDFGAPHIRHDFFCVGAEICGTGDFDGDGYGDVITFLRSTGNHGDVHVGRSNAGARKTWQVRANELQVVSAEDRRGDDPYLIALSFRVTPTERGSTRVWTNNYDFHLGRNVGSQPLAIPASMGVSDFSNLALPSLSRVIRTGELPELFGTIYIAMDSDKTTWRRVDMLVEAMAEELQSVLERQVERANILEMLSPTGLRDKLREIRSEVRGSMELSLGQKLALVFVSSADPDDLIGYHVFVGVALDKDAGDDISFPYNRHVSGGVIGESWWAIYSRSIYFYDDNSRIDEDVRYRVGLSFAPVP